MFALFDFNSIAWTKWTKLKSVFQSWIRFETFEVGIPWEVSQKFGMKDIEVKLIHLLLYHYISFNTYLPSINLVKHNFVC